MIPIWADVELTMLSDVELVKKNKTQESLRRRQEGNKLSRSTSASLVNLTFVGQCATWNPPQLWNEGNLIPVIHNVCQCVAVLICSRPACKLHSKISASFSTLPSNIPVLPTSDFRKLPTSGVFGTSDFRVPVSEVLKSTSAQPCS